MRLRNPFIRRITRHTSVSTLFRMPESAPEAAPSLIGSGRPRAHPFEAVAQTLPGPELARLPAGRLANRPMPIPREVEIEETAPSTEEMIRRVEQPSLQRQAVRPVQSYPAPTEPSANVPTWPSSQAQPASSEPAKPEEKGPSEALEQDWSRLQNILRRHQEAEDQTEPETGSQPSGEASLASRQTGEGEASVQRQPAPADQSVEARQEETPRRAQVTEVENPSLPGSAAQRETPGAQGAAENEFSTFTEPSSSEPLPESGMVRADSSVQTEPLEPLADEELLKSSQQPTLVSGSRQQEKSVGEEETGSPPATAPEKSAALQAKQVQTAPEPQPASSPKPGSEQPITQSTADRVPIEPLQVEEDFEPPELEQALPLESAWPVQRRPQAQPAPTQILPRATPSEDSDLQEEALDTGQIQQIETVLGSVPVGQRTDSHVEVITPRKPRPKAPAVQRTPAQEPATQTPAEPDSFPEVPVSPIQAANEPEIGEPKMGEARAQAQPSIEAAPTVISQSAPSSQPGHTAPGSSQVVQRQPTPPEEPQMVETEIGPLPADLWRLMGTTPPADKMNPTAPGKTQEQAGPVGAESSKATGPVQAGSLEGSPALATFPAAAVQRWGETEDAPAQQAAAPAVIQRETAAPTRESSTSASGETATAPAEGEENREQPRAAEVNTDELARKVYSYIKRKLMVEWERLRKRS